MHNRRWKGAPGWGYASLLEFHHHRAIRSRRPEGEGPSRCCKFIREQASDAWFNQKRGQADLQQPKCGTRHVIWNASCRCHLEAWKPRSIRVRPTGVLFQLSGRNLDTQLWATTLRLWRGSQQVSLPLLLHLWIISFWCCPGLHHTVLYQDNMNEVWIKI